MKIKRSYLIALGLLLLIALWFVIGSRKKASNPAPNPVNTEQAAPTVEIKRISAERHESYM